MPFIILDMSQESKDLEILYEIFEGDEKKKSFPVILDHTSLNLKAQENCEAEWTLLEYCQCSHCPLKKEEYTHCPVAMNLSEASARFTDSISHHEVKVRVTLEGKTIEKTLPLQKALASLFGIYMVASPCPIMSFMKPLLRYHLPFAKTDETIFRVLGSFLLGQYFCAERGEEVHWNFDDLIKKYEAVHLLNQAMRKRISSISTKDANMNAIVSLDNFAVNAEFRLNVGILDELRQLYTL